MELSLEAPKSAGCLVSWDDFPRICASLSVYGACLGFGAGLAALGASVPELAGSIHTRDTNIGRMFVFRGFGFLGGALLSTKLLRMKLRISKHALCCAAITIAGLSLAVVPYLSSTINDDTSSAMHAIVIYLICLLFFIEGMCFGGIDAFSALSISEMWGQRTQPWMQAKNLFANFGCLLGPTLVSEYGYGTGFLLIGAVGCASLVGILMLYSNNFVRRCMGLPGQDNNVQCAELSAIELTIDAIDTHGAGTDIDSPHGEPNEWGDLVYRVLDEVQQSQQSSQNNSPEKKTVFDFANVALSPQKRPVSLDFSLSNMEQQRVSSPQVNPTLAYASPELARKVRRTRKPVGIVLVPFKVRVLLALFVFWELGLMCSFGGWISTYVSTLRADIVADSGVDVNTGANANASAIPDAGTMRFHTTGHGWHSLSLQQSGDVNVNAEPDEGAIALSIFYALQIVSSILSIPASVIFSTSTLLRCQLGLAVVAGALLCLPTSLFSEHLVYATIYTSAGLMGTALGCMYPLAMTIVNDYGATMTSNSTIAVVLGGCVGEATAPFIVALAIAQFGPSAFPVSVVLLIVALVATYLILHVYLKYTPVVQYDTSVEKVTRQCSPVRLKSNASSQVGSNFGGAWSRTASPTELNVSTKDNNNGSSRGGSAEYSPLRRTHPNSNEFTPLVLPAREDRRTQPQSQATRSLYKTSFGVPSASAINTVNCSYEGLNDEAL